jgi:hypothetical protein
MRTSGRTGNRTETILYYESSALTGGIAPLLAAYISGPWLTGRMDFGLFGARHGEETSNDK